MTRGLHLLLWLALAGAPVSRAGILFSENFDSTALPTLPAGWSSAGTGLPWRVDDTAADTPPAAAWLTRSGTTNVGSQTLTGPEFSLTALPMRLRFQHRHRLDYSSGQLQIAFDGGPFVEFAAAGGLFNTNGYSSSGQWSGSQYFFEEVSALLPPAGLHQSARLRWVFTQTSYYSYYQSDYWALDSITVDDSYLTFPDDLSVSIKESSDPVATGASCTFTLTVTNSGPSDATGVLLTNLLPAGAPLESLTASQGTATNQGGVLTCQFGTIPGGGTASVIFTLGTSVAAQWTNRTGVSRSEADTFLLNNTASSVTTVTPPVLAVGDASVPESANGGVALFELSLRPAPLTPVVVSFATSNGTAVAGLDYHATNGMVTFDPGETFKTVAVAVRGDLIDEFDETFFLVLSPPAGIDAGRLLGGATIVDDDPSPSVIVIDADVVEGDQGTTNAVFRVFLSQPSGVTNAASFSTGSLTATENDDFTDTNGTIFFAPGEIERTVTVRVRGDRTLERGETFYLSLSGLSSQPPYTSFPYGGQSATGFIQNDDGLPGKVDSFSWDAIASPHPLNLPVPVTVRARDYFGDIAASFDGNATVTALGFSGENGEAGTFQSPTNTSYSDTYRYGYTVGQSFTPATNLVVTHLRRAFGDRVSLWREDGQLLATAQPGGLTGVWTEVELDPPVQLSGGVRYTLGALVSNSSYYGRYYYYDPPAFTHGTYHGPREAYGDRVPTNTSYGSYNWQLDFRYQVGTVTALALNPASIGPFTNGVWSGAIEILTVATNAQFRVTGPAGQTGVSGRFTLALADDLELTMVAPSAPLAVGTAFTNVVRVANSGPAPATDVVVTNWPPAGAALFSASASAGTVTNEAGALVWQVGTLAGSSAAELTLGFLSAAPGVLTNRAQATRAEPDAFEPNNSASAATVVVLPALSVTNIFALERDTNATNVTLTLRLHPPSLAAVSVAFATQDATALAGTDYATTNGVIVFAPGVTSRPVVVTILGDTVDEDDETFQLVFTNPNGLTPPPAPVVVTIQDNDAPPYLSILGTSVTEGNAGMKDLTFIGILSKPSSRVVSFRYTHNMYYYSSGESATPFNDYLPQEGVMVFAPGTTLGTAVFSVFGDTAVEPNESVLLYTLSLSNAYSAGNSPSFILNDDGIPGELYQFSVDAPATRQHVGEPFAATVTARDYFGAPLTNLSGAVALTARAQAGPAAKRILSDLPASGSEAGNYTLGYGFIPSTALMVTHFRHYHGVKVSLWKASGELLAAQSVLAPGNAWNETALDTPVILQPGQEYLLTAYVGGGWGYYRTDGTNTFPHGVLTRSLYSNGDQFPYGTSTARWPLLDLRYLVADHRPLALDLPPTPVFSNGVWSGTLTALDAGYAVNLLAGSGAATGASGLFDILGPQLRLEHTADGAILSWPALTPGYELESAPALTNAWTPVATPPVEQAGRKTVTNTMDADALFYRLRRP